MRRSSRIWRWRRWSRPPLVREGQVTFGDFEAYPRMTPAQQVGGDFVDMLERAAGTLFVTVGDVSGKGVPAALFMAAAQGAITSVASGTGNIAAIGSEVNRRLCHENPMGLFVTCVLATVDLKEGVVEYVCAGHEPAVIVQADGSRRVLPMTGGLAMGVIDDFEYDMRREALHATETLFLYTDGLTDAVNGGGELFGKGPARGHARRRGAALAGADCGPRLAQDRRLLRRGRGR